MPQLRASGMACINTHSSPASNERRKRKACERKYDIVLYGATGTLGFLTAKYLAKAAPARGKSFAIAGRNKDKLSIVREKLGLENVDYIIADSKNKKTLSDMCKQCSIMASCVGPYLNYGLELIDVCIQTGTHYCDVTKEYPFVYQSLTDYHEKSANKGVKVVHCCGYDSTPADVGAFLAYESLRSEPIQIRGLYTAMCSLASRDSVQSDVLVKKWEAKPTNKKLKQDPYLLALDTKEEFRCDTKMSSTKYLGYDSVFATITLPVSKTNTANRVVRRSIALRGSKTSYDEAISIGNVVRQSSFIMSRFPSYLASKKSELNVEARLQKNGGNGYFEFEVKAEGNDKQTCTVKVRGNVEPHYEATSVIFAESAMCLTDTSPNENCFEGGVLTPSTAMGNELIKRLKDTGRFGFVVEKLN